MRRQQVETRAFLLVVLLTTIAFLWIVRGFLMPVFWAVVFAVLARPLYRRILRAVRNRQSLAALITTLIVVLVILIPLGLLGLAVTQQAIGLYQRVSSGEVNVQAVVEFVERAVPAVTGLLEDFGVSVESIENALRNSAVAAGEWGATKAVAIGQSTITLLVFFVLMLYFLFFFIRDAERILDWIIRALPLGDEREMRLFKKFAEVSRATMKGTLVVAIVQGGIGGVLFAIAGINAAVFWGVVMAVASLLPVVGTALIWVPAAIIMFATGAIWEGILIFAGGTILVGMVDNFLRPILVGYDTKMPDYLVLLTTLGGLALFGLAGVVLGPLVGAMFLVVWEMMAEEYATIDTPSPLATPVTSAELPLEPATSEDGPPHSAATPSTTQDSEE